MQGPIEARSLALFRVCMHVYWRGQVGELQGRLNRGIDNMN